MLFRLSRAEFEQRKGAGNREAMRRIVRRGDEVVVLNQFAEFGNAIWHYVCTGRAMEEAFETVREAAEAPRRQRFARQVAAELAELREDPQVWEAYLAEADEMSVGDGIG